MALAKPKPTHTAKLKAVPTEPVDNVVPITKGKKPAVGSAVALKKPGGAVVSIMDALRSQAATTSERTAPASGITIRATQDKKFKLPSGETVEELELVVVDFVSRNDFYEGTYDANAITPPACFAIGTNPAKMVPSANSPQAQADDCTSCPMNAFGSSGKGKACKNGRVLAVLPPDADADTPLWLLKVSPTGLKSFDSFVQGAARTFQMPPVGVVVRVSFDENVTFASLRFNDAVPNGNVETHFGRQDEAKELLNTEPDVNKYEAPKPKGRTPLRSVQGGRR